MFGAGSSLAIALSGHFQARTVAHTQPAKLAAFEGHFRTGPADLYLFGLPDAERGEMACAVIVVADGGDAPALPDLFEYLTDKGLSVQKIPERLEIVDVLPRNPAGKVLKHELRSSYS